VLIVIVIVPILVIWTGYGLFQLLGPRSLRVEFYAGLFILGLTGILAIGWIGLIAAELGLFSAGVITVLGALVGATGWLVQRRRGSRIALDRSNIRVVEIIFLVSLMVLMGLLYLRPHEFIFGGADAGVYVNLGAQLARSGSWLIHNPDLAAIPAADYPMFFREQPPYLRPQYYYLPGFYVAESGAATILPQFYPLHAIWLALAHGLGGLSANLYMTPLWGILGVLAFYLAVRESFDRGLAALAAVLLALTPTQVWFARYPTAEVLTQFLLFSGLYAFARYARYDEKWSAVLAGLALGQVMLARIDTYFLLGIPLGYAAYLRLRRKLDQRFLFFVVPMLAMAVHSLVHGIWQARPYMYNTFGGLLTPAHVAMLGGGLLIFAMVFVVMDKLVTRYPDWRVRLQTVWRTTQLVVSIVLVLLAIYAYFILPLYSDPARQTLYWYGQHTIPDVEPFNFVRLGWYLSPLGLALGVCGIATLIRRDISERTWLIASVGVFFSILFVYRTFNNPHHVYVMRRYVPAVIPTFTLGIAYAAWSLTSWRRVNHLVATGLVASQLAWMVYSARIMFFQVDYQGGVAQFDRLAGMIPADAVVVFNENQPVGSGAVYGTPLAYLKGYTVLSLRGDHVDHARLDALVNGWLAAQRPVVVIDTPARVEGLCDRWQCSLLGVAQFDMHVLESSYYHFPKLVVKYRERLELYQVDEVEP